MLIFNKLHSELINILLFDSSVNLHHINGALKNNELSIEIERRCFEDIKRIKKLWVNFTLLKGKKSIIKMFNVKKISIFADEKQQNDFIVNSLFENDRKLLIYFVKSKIEIDFYSDINIFFEDIKDSKVGKGIVIGKVGLTKEEWNIKLAKYRL